MIYIRSLRTIIQENYRELIERKVVSLDDYSKIFEYCRQKKIEFVVSVYDDDGVAFAKEQQAVGPEVQILAGRQQNQKRQ